MGKFPLLPLRQKPIESFTLPTTPTLRLKDHNVHLELEGALGGLIATLAVQGRSTLDTSSHKRKSCAASKLKAQWGQDPQAPVMEWRSSP